ncbi:MAG: hypothetical protein ACPLW8_03250, partial [Candidatus Bathyarchaeales archaeon]
MKHHFISIGVQNELNTHRKPAKTCSAKLDAVKLGLLRLRAMLLPEELTEKEKKELEEAKNLNAILH